MAEDPNTLEARETSQAPIRVTDIQQSPQVSNGVSTTEAVEPADSEGDNEKITSAEIALYDRQIRLWGMQAQERIRTANVLLIGLRGLGNEVAKNLVLAGIGSLTIVDDQPVGEEDLGAQFLYFKQNVGEKRAEAAMKELRAMNNRVKLTANTSSVIDLVTDPLFFQQFSIVIATDLPVDMLQTINSACRLSSKPFYGAATYGFYGYVFADLIQHEFILEREKSNKTTQIGPETVTRSVISTATKKSDAGKTIELVTKVEQYSPLSQVLNALLPADRLTTRRRKLQITPILSCIKALWNFQMNTARTYPDETSKEDLAAFTKLATDWHKNFLMLPPETLKAETLRQFLQGVSTEWSPTCAFVGGALAQNVINVIGKNEQPFQNLLIWDSEALTGEIYAMHLLTPAISGVQVDMSMGAAVSDSNGVAINEGMNGNPNGAISI